MPFISRSSMSEDSLLFLVEAIFAVRISSPRRSWPGKTRRKARRASVSTSRSFLFLRVPDLSMSTRARSGDESSLEARVPCSRA